MEKTMKTTENYLIEFVEELGEISKNVPTTIGASLQHLNKVNELITKHARLIEAAIIASISSTKN